MRRSRALAVGCVGTGKSGITAFRRAMLELSFPGQCVRCGEQLLSGDTAGSGVGLCDACCQQIALLSGPVCHRCGAPVPDTGCAPDDNSKTAARRDGCRRCRGRKLWFDATIAAGLYAGPLRELLLQMKSAEGNAISLAVGRLLWHRCGVRLKEAAADVVVPVPLHWRRRLSHRTNSAAMVAEVLAGQLGLPLAEGLLRRRRSTKPQFDLTPSRRWENVRGAFSVGAGYHLRSARVLLVDDILTTGATCSEAARTLREAGAQEVVVTVVARAFGEFVK